MARYRQTPVAIVLLIICNCTTIVGAEELGQPTGQDEVTLVPLALAAGSKQIESRVTRRTKIVLGCTALLIGLGLIIALNRPSPPAVEYTDQASIRAAMKWPAWKIVLDRLLSLVPPLRNALNPTLNVNATLMEVRVSPDLVASNLLSSLPKTVTNHPGGQSYILYTRGFAFSRSWPGIAKCRSQSYCSLSAIARRL